MQTQASHGHARQIQIAGTNIELWEGGAGRPLLVLHPGDGFDAQAPYVAALAPHFRVIAPSCPGFGRSADPPGYMRSVDDLSYFYLDLLEALDLKDLAIGHATTRPDNGIAGADDDVRVHIDRTRAILQRAGEAIMHASKSGLSRVAQIEIGKELPHEHRDIAHERLLDPAEPTHEAGQRAPGDAVGQQEVQLLLLQKIHYR